MRKVGLSPKFAISEVFGFDEDLLAFLPQPVNAVIVNLERLKKTEDKARGSADALKHVQFYMKQSSELDNACGIIACIHGALNTATEVIPDSILGKYKASTASMTPEQRCTALENDNAFKQQHAMSASEGQTAAITGDQDKVTHHFIAFVVSDGKLIELDGTKLGPVVIGDCDDVLRGTIAEIQKRLAVGEISESLSMVTLGGAQED
jgi:ubiquitin carboxyl-terminal hydrolase L3